MSDTNAPETVKDARTRKYTPDETAFVKTEGVERARPLSEYLAWGYLALGATCGILAFAAELVRR